MEIVTGYILATAVIVAAVGFFYYVAPLFKKNLGNVIDIVIELIAALQRELQTGQLDPNDPDYATKKAALDAEQRENCLKAIKEILVKYNLPVPPDEIIYKAIDEGKKLLGYK